MPDDHWLLQVGLASPPFRAHLCRQSIFFNVDQDFGKRLTHARLERGLTVEEAAHGTRMRPGLIRALEDSNLSQFPNAAYAKSFLLMYAKYLHIDLTAEAGTIDTSTQMRVEDFQYLTSLASDEKRHQREASTDARYDFVVARKTGRSWLPLILLVIAGGIGLAIFVVVNNLHRFDSTKPTTPASTAQVPTPTPTPAPAKPEGTHAAEVAVVPPGPAEAHPERTTNPPPTAPGPAPLEGTPPPVPPTGPAVAANNASVPALTPDPAPGPEEDNTAPPLPPGTLVLEPVRKTWVIIRTGPGGQLLYEDFLYPTAKAMHLPAGKYFIELRDDPTGVEISKDGKAIAYTSPGVLAD